MSRPGIESGGQTEIKRGLKAGQRVVVSSQFLIDSEASLKGVEARLNSEPVPTMEMPSGMPGAHAMIARADPLVDRQPLPGAAGHR